MASQSNTVPHLPFQITGCPVETEFVNFPDNLSFFCAFVGASIVDRLQTARCFRVTHKKISQLLHHVRQGDRLHIDRLDKGTPLLLLRQIRGEGGSQGVRRLLWDRRFPPCERGGDCARQALAGEFIDAGKKPDIVESFIRLLARPRITIA